MAMDSCKLPVEILSYIVDIIIEDKLPHMIFQIATSCRLFNDIINAKKDKIAKAYLESIIETDLLPDGQSLLIHYDVLGKVRHGDYSIYLGGGILGYTINKKYHIGRLLQAEVQSSNHNFEFLVKFDNVAKSQWADINNYGVPKIMGAILPYNLYRRVYDKLINAYAFARPGSINYTPSPAYDKWLAEVTDFMQHLVVDRELYNEFLVASVFG